VRVSILSTFFVAVALGGCASPQTADEFRQTKTKVDAHEVNRPLREVAATLRSRAPECLSATVRRTIPGPTYTVIDVAYKPKVVVTERKAELLLQMKYVRGVATTIGEPEGGYYVLVADVYAVDSKHSRTEMFASGLGGYDPVVRAINGWIDGKDLGCPDLSKVG